MDCRFYDKSFPNVEDVVLVQVKSLSDIGAYVSLLEYGNLEGMIQISEMSNRRIRSISKLTRVGQVEVCLVLRVDTDRGYVDLSKRRVNAEDTLKAKDLYSRAKIVHGIMRHVSTITGEDLASVCSQISWPLYKQGGSAYETLRRFVNDGVAPLEITPPLLDALRVAAARKLTPHEVRVRAIFDVTCLHTDGVFAIRDALIAVKMACPEIVMKLVSAPHFLVETSGIGKEACIARINAALLAVEKEVTQREGTYKLVSPPDVIGDDEEELPKLIDEDVSSDEEDGEKPDQGSSSSGSSSDSSSDDEEEA